MANRDLSPWSGGGRLSRYEDPFSDFRRQFDSLFDDFLGRPGETRSFAPGATAARPAVDVRETEKAFEVCAELPGLDAKDVEINLRDNVLTISGEKRQERSSGEGEKSGRSWSERTWGRFQRAIPLPEEVDADKVEAKAKDGVITITLPKSEKAEEKTRRIEIRS